MATQFCSQGFVDIMTELKQRALMAKEGKVRLLDQAEAHLPEYFRLQELLRNESRIQKGEVRSIDILIYFAYKEKKGEKPYYNPWMVEYMVVQLPFSLEILLDDLQIFLNFESGQYLTFWQEVKRRVELTTFVDPKGNSVRTQYAALQAQRRFQSYWPRTNSV